MAFVLAAAAFLGVRPAAAQQGDTARITTALWVICPGAYLKLVVDDAPVSGKCGSVGNDSLSIRGEAGDRRYPLAAVDSLWVRRGRTPELTLGLALLGGVMGGVYASRRTVEDCGPVVMCIENPDPGIARSAVAGMLGGTALGVVIGPRVWRWVRRYPAAQP
ncbi:MAG TPA: hypothetical protein VEY93_01445 [Longimicrobium sp.]|nr:hypothetical protein [Longimicrobium sp.]